MEYIEVYEDCTTGFAGSYVLWVFVWYNVRLVVIVVCCEIVPGGWLVGVFADN